MATKSLTTQLKINRAENLDEYRRNAPAVLGVPGAARFLGVSEKTLLKYADDAKIPYRKLGETRIFSRDALISWVADDGAEEGREA